MNIENLEVGKTFRNLRHLQEVLGIPIGVSSNSKNAQLKELARYCKYNRHGHKFTIEEVYEFPLGKIDYRGGNNLLKVPLTISNPLLTEEWLIEENKMSIPQTLTRRSTQKFWWKCGKCENKIFSSPLKRLNAVKGVTDDCITCPYCSMSKGAKRIYKFLRQYDIDFKLEHTFDDLIGTGNKKLRFDFAIFNNSDNLVLLIEFDGEYHDEELNPDIENYKTVSTHDKIKDDYCNVNNIPLLRIHHTQVEDSFICLARHFQNLDINQDQQNKMLNDCNNLISYENERACLLLKLNELDKKISSINK